MPHHDAAQSWDPTEDAALIDELGRGRPVEAIAGTLRRSPAEVRARLDALANPANEALADSTNVLFPKDIAAS